MDDFTKNNQADSEIPDLFKVIKIVLAKPEGIKKEVDHHTHMEDTKNHKKTISKAGLKIKVIK